MPDLRGCVEVGIVVPICAVTVYLDVSLPARGLNESAWR